MCKPTREELEASRSSYWETLESMVREHVQEFIQQVLEEERDEFVRRAKYQRRKDVDAPAGYRNGYGKPRRLALKTGTIVVRRPRVRGLEEKFESRILPLFKRRTRELDQMLPDLYLHGLSLGDFELALRGLLGDGAPLSPSSIERLKAKWQLEYDFWSHHRLTDRDVVYVWADGIYVKAGLEKDKAALLVIIGAMRDGRKEVLAVRSGYRESEQSWMEVLRDLRDRGLPTPKLGVADGATGFWAAAGQVWPEMAGQRCWNHKITNVMDKLPKRLQAEARQMLCKIPYAETVKEAMTLRDAFAQRYEGDYPEAVNCLRKDWDALVTFYRYPTEHWKHLRTTNVVESPFAAVRLRTGAAKRFKKVKNASMLIWKVLQLAQRTFRRLDAPELLVDVYVGREFVDGRPVPKVSASNDERQERLAVA